MPEQDDLEQTLERLQEMYSSAPDSETTKEYEAKIRELERDKEILEEKLSYKKERKREEARQRRKELYSRLADLSKPISKIGLTIVAAGAVLYGAYTYVIVPGCTLVKDDFQGITGEVRNVIDTDPNFYNNVWKGEPYNREFNLHLHDLSDYKYSPDRKHVVMLVGDIRTNLYVVDSKGSNLVELVDGTDSNCADKNIFWVDNNTIAFKRTQYPKSITKFMQMDIDENNVGYNLRGYNPR